MKTKEMAAFHHGADIKGGALLRLRMDWRGLGESIRRRRLQRKISQRQIADMHGLSRSSISRLECRGASCNVETLLTLTIMLDIDLHTYVFAMPESPGRVGALTLAAIMNTMPVMGTA